MGAGGGQRSSVVHGLSPRPAGRVPVRRTRPQIHRTARLGRKHTSGRRRACSGSMLRGCGLGAIAVATENPALAPSSRASRSTSRRMRGRGAGVPACFTMNGCYRRIGSTPSYGDGSFPSRVQTLTRHRRIGPQLLDVPCNLSTSASAGGRSGAGSCPELWEHRFIPSKMSGWPQLHRPGTRSSGGPEAPSARRPRAWSVQHRDLADTRGRTSFGSLGRGPQGPPSVGVRHTPQSRLFLRGLDGSFRAPPRRTLSVQPCAEAREGLGHVANENTLRPNPARRRA